MTPEQTNLLSKIITESATAQDFLQYSDSYSTHREFFGSDAVTSALKNFGWFEQVNVQMISINKVNMPRNVPNSYIIVDSGSTDFAGNYRPGKRIQKIFSHGQCIYDVKTQSNVDDT
jgi:hypothetical protein